MTSSWWITSATTLFPSRVWGTAVRSQWIFWENTFQLITITYKPETHPKQALWSNSNARDMRKKSLQSLGLSRSYDDLVFFHFSFLWFKLVIISKKNSWRKVTPKNWWSTILILITFFNNYICLLVTVPWVVMLTFVSLYTTSVNVFLNNDWGETFVILKNLFNIHFFLKVEIAFCQYPFSFTETFF
jgi:hypothetical protein